MATLQLKRLPDDLHAALRERAEREGVTLSELVTRILRRELALPSMSEWISAVREQPLLDRDLPVESLMDDVRDDLARHAGR